jgi:hypothetical protein
MQDWELDFKWLRVRHFVKSKLNKEELPDLNSILLLIGIQEANIYKKSFTKEEKQDLMHVATCHLMTERGYFEFIGNDQDGWPHYKQIRVLPVEGANAQEDFLKQCVINYFETYKDLMTENEN